MASVLEIMINHLPEMPVAQLICLINISVSTGLPDVIIMGGIMAQIMTIITSFSVREAWTSLLLIWNMIRLQILRFWTGQIIY